mmetsp:Transcript_5497/g.8380  ORF Transcript_5497/g.8380 Transcript_5497/m.8380 type:complete len:172 (+) Transcript_5497:141-656(+)|eukprot:CAMPEP_0195298068 /NCGR_PEP_ID=MMETSP0707-20130614/22700_1 /TAXON_ID=33640 /ORGANISM="Asterionellopsis glacialis, Strain CCMP134" /LENGTH=171 /DNA_ID=CAMNT_0040360049 /DNA_START=76 /DNA_END=591 /DNA_ORIENTATION=+
MNLIARSKLILKIPPSLTTNIYSTTAASSLSSSQTTTTTTFLSGLRNNNRNMSSTSTFPIQQSIQTKLTEELNPIHLDVINESHMHNVPENSETHFKVVVVSDQFEDMKTIQRHRTVYKILGEEMSPTGGKVHAMAIVAKTPSQWSKTASIPPSPSCRGGDGSLPSKHSTN